MLEKVSYMLFLMRLETQRFYRADWTDEEAYENVGQET
jgi:hypothetical protein